MESRQSYTEFLKNKILISEDFGFDVKHEDLNEWLKPHCKDIVLWALKGGRRAIFASFGLHKTSMQLEIANQVIEKTGKPFIIVCPLAVVNEFRQDNDYMGGQNEITYITDSDTIENYKPQIFITNYERVRKGDIDPSKFGGCSFDEASILRNLKTETTNYVLHHFRKIKYRFVATATPTPNDYIEILNYAIFLGVASRGHLLTRFFKRNPTKAGDLKLNENKKKEFWQWVNTWAVFITKPSDLGYSDEGYILPELNIIEHCIDTQDESSYINKEGALVMFKDISKSLVDVSKEKRDSIIARCDAAYNVAKKCKSAILWHDLEPERMYLEKLFKEESAFAVYGSQKNTIKEQLLSDFANGLYDYLLTKAKIAGSGCNFQGYCHDALFVGINYKFNDFIQAIHRLLRYGQKFRVNVHLFFTRAEYEVLKVLYKKWDQHKELQKVMIELVKEYGLNKDIIKQQMERQLFIHDKKVIIGNAELHNNDTVIVHENMESNSKDMILTSIPFGDHYEYSENYNDFGHNDGNAEFFKQMDFLTPHLLRVLRPGRIAAIHVKDRIRYSYQNGTKFTTVDDFCADVSTHFRKHGFYLTGKVTVTTDVVAENNQTNRLTWKEQRKDATRNGVGSPEYIYIFRKPPSHTNNSYADTPVKKTKEEYDIAVHQVNASSFHKSDGNRLLTSQEISRLDISALQKLWKERLTSNIYNYKEHVQACRDLEVSGKLSKLYTTLPLHSNSDNVWSDINRMNTLNTKQVSNKKETHICPLQLDIIERLIDWFTMPGETIDDPFGGLFSTPYIALQMGRKCVSVELNAEYFKDGLYYVNAMLHKLSVPTLFDFIEPKLKEVI